MDELERRFAELAGELAGQDPGLGARLAAARAHAERLHALAARCVDAFARAAVSAGAAHLTDLALDPLGPDAKHVDALQFALRRGRLELIATAIASAEGAKLRVVGPFQRGKKEGPCATAPLADPAAEELLAERIEALLREAASA